MSEEEALLLDDDDDDDGWLDAEIAKRQKAVEAAEAKGARLDTVIERGPDACVDVVLLDAESSEEDVFLLLDDQAEEEDEVALPETIVHHTSVEADNAEERCDFVEADNAEEKFYEKEIETEPVALLEDGPPPASTKNSSVIDRLVKSAFLGKILSKRWARRKRELEISRMAKHDLESRKFEEHRRLCSLRESREIEDMRAEETATILYANEEKRRRERALRAAENAKLRMRQDEARRVAEAAREALDIIEEQRRLVERTVDEAVETARKAVAALPVVRCVRRISAAVAAYEARDLLDAKAAAEEAISEEIRKKTYTKRKQIKASSLEIFAGGKCFVAADAADRRPPTFFPDNPKKYHPPLKPVMDNNPLVSCSPHRDIVEACVEGLTSAECLRGCRASTLKVNVNQLQSLDFVRDMPLLRVLEARDNRLSEISRIPQNLRDLDVSVNAVERIETSDSLSRLRAADNRLLEVPLLKNIVWLDLAGNSLGPTLRIDDTASLRHLDVSRNSLRVLDVRAGNFLKTLVASNNLLESASHGDVPVEILRLNDNRLCDIKTNCVELYVAHNRLESLVERQLPNVAKLDCSHNYITLGQMPFCVQEVTACGNPLPRSRYSDCVETALKLWRKDSFDARSVVFARGARKIDGHCAPFDSHQMKCIELISKIFPARCRECGCRVAPTSTLFFFKERSLQCKCGTLLKLPTVSASFHKRNLEPTRSSPSSSRSRDFASRLIQRAWKVTFPRRHAVVKLQTVARGRTLRNRLRAALDNARYVDRELETILAQSTAVPEEEEEEEEAQTFDKWRLPPLSDSSRSMREEETERKKWTSARPPTLRPQKTTVRRGGGRRKKKLAPAWLKMAQS